ncbi:hypothetical protein H9Q10_11730 [Eikenella sp. S3360]|uniref:Uncharacterized protein n=1 Tax=Eikenella glucosivorans TaxID=2766967 RepID=A0ABS0NDF7_9NEIS|nr:hypothetical protein [Eikenella glucosivorans]MBH5330333.1 hypothetical protein [Eikenella glucosivorans]
MTSILINKLKNSCFTANPGKPGLLEAAALRHADERGSNNLRCAAWQQAAKTNLHTGICRQEGIDRVLIM